MCVCTTCIYVCVYIHLCNRHIMHIYVYGDTHIHIYMGNKFTFRKREPGQYPPYHFI